MTVAYSHLHSALASAHFDLKDAVKVRRWGPEVWAVYLDNSLSRFEVFIDAKHGRVFTHPDTWDGLNGPAEVAFEDDFITAYRQREGCVLVRMEREVYQAGARLQAVAEGTDAVPSSDRLEDLARRAQEAIVAAAGLNTAPSLTQGQVFAARHVGLVQDLAALQAEVDRIRDMVLMSAEALGDVFDR